MAAPGRIVDGRYVVEAELGSGGMGVVLRVRHRFTGALHALKMLRPDFALDAEAQTRFLAEARAATAIGHHGIVSVLDAGKTPEGELYLVMELLQGQPLRNAMVRTGITAPELRRIGLELLDALGAAHARGFVHRDLKPENVFLVAPAATVKLLDFGIAKIAQGVNMTSAPRTAAGVVLGTLAYMAPEQLHDARSVDPRADLWAAGVMFYEMLAGRLPWPQHTMTELYIALESGQTTPIQTYLPAASPPIVAFFARALSRDPRGRFQSTAEMAAALAALPLTITAGPVASQVAVTQHTGVTVATAARAPALPSMHAPPAAVAPASPAAPTAHVRGIATKTWLALGLALLAAGLIVAAVVIATRDGKHTTIAVAEPKPLPERHVVDDKGQNIQIDPPRPVDPAPPPPAPPAPPAPVKKPVVPPPAATGEKTIGGVTRAQFCTTVCATASKCSLGVPNCMQACEFDAKSVACVSKAQNCNDFAGCVFEVTCNARPSGAQTCGQTLSCQAQCGSDGTCSCRCAQPMSIQHAQLLLSVDLCLGTCNNDPQCAQQRCSGLATQCLSQ